MFIHTVETHLAVFTRSEKVYLDCNSSIHNLCLLWL